MVRCSVFPYVSQLNLYGHREPAPLHYFKRIHPGDVGYIRRGCFHLLFSAGRPQGERRLGVHVPRSFKQLEVGPIFNTQPRLPGHLSTNSVRETRARLAPSTSPDPYVRSIPSVSSSISCVLQDFGTRFQLLIPTHGRSRCCSCDQVSHPP